MHLKVTALAREVGAIGVFDRREFSVTVKDDIEREALTLAIIKDIRNQGFEIQALLRVRAEDA